MGMSSPSPDSKGAPRNVIEDTAFERDKENLGVTPRLLDEEILFGVSWVLGHDHTKGVLIPGTRLYAIATTFSDRLGKEFVIFYTVEGERIRFVGIIEAMAGESGEGDDATDGCEAAEAD